MYEILSPSQFGIKVSSTVRALLIISIRCSNGYSTFKYNIMAI